MPDSSFLRRDIKIAFQNIGERIKQITLIMLLLGAFVLPAFGQRGLHYEIKRSKDKHVWLKKATASDILYRTANPLPTDPKQDFRSLQTKFLDLSEPIEREYLRVLQQETDPNIFYMILGWHDGGSIKKYGTRSDISTGETLQLFERIGTEDDLKIAVGHFNRPPTGYYERQLSSDSGHGATSLRRHGLSSAIVGYFFGKAMPRSILWFEDDRQFLSRTRRVDAAVDVSYGTASKGNPLPGRIEYSLQTLANELYLHVETDKDLVVWAGDDFGDVLWVIEAGKESQAAVLDGPKKVSGLVFLEHWPLMYNPQDLTAGEACSIKRNIPSSIDIVVVDKEPNDMALRLVKVGEHDVGIISSQYWRRPYAVPDVHRVVLTKDLEQVIEEGSMITLPKGTRIVKDGYSIGIPVARPSKMPLAKCATATKTWYLFDADELMDLVSNSFVASIGDKRIPYRLTIDGRIVNEAFIQKEHNMPTPFLMWGKDDELIEIRFGINWEDPWTKALAELDRRGLVAMTYDAKTRTFKYYEDGSIPPTQEYSMQRPVYENIPAFDER